MLNQLICRVQLDSWVHVHLDPPIFVDNPLAEVPRQLEDTAWLLTTLQLFRIATQPLEHIMSLWPINKYLVHQRKPYIELRNGVAFYLLVCILLLIQELAAGKPDHLQPILLVSLMQLDHLSVVALGEGSL